MRLAVAGNINSSVPGYLNDRVPGGNNIFTGNFALTKSQQISIWNYFANSHEIWLTDRCGYESQNLVLIK
jgi:hypothetical protein